MESKDMSKAKAVSTNRVKKSREDWIFDIILYTIGVLLIIITLYPMYFIVIASFSDPAAVSNGQIMFLPKGVNFKGYKQLASYAKLWTGYRNTIAYVIMGTLVTLVVNIPASYALSRKHLYGRRFFTAFYLIPMFFTGGLIPTYLAVQRFHLLDTFWVMVVPFSVVTYYIIVGRTFFNNSIPEDLWEAAQLDGASAWQSFIHITVPHIRMVVGLLVVLRTIWVFNSFDIIYLITGGGPANLTQTVPIYAYNLGWGLKQLGRSSAVTVLLLLFLLVVCALYFRLLNKWEKEGE